MLIEFTNNYLHKNKIVYSLHSYFFLYIHIPEHNGGVLSKKKIIPRKVSVC